MSEAIYRASNGVAYERAGAGLEQWQFRRIATNGFGDPHNAYAHTMVWFRGRLYVGTTRANLCMLKARSPFAASPWPVECPDDIFHLDLRAQIWEYDPVTASWQQVHIAPSVVGRTGERVPREIGYRGMTVFQGPRDPEPVLYVATWAPSRGPGPLALRSTDGREFVPVSEPGLGDPTVSTFRSLTPFNGRLFVAPTGRPGGKPNTPDNPVVLESFDPNGGSWHLASPPGFGDPSNLTVFEMTAFDGHLYAGTLNAQGGYQVWKTRAEGTPPYRWTRVLANGAHRGPLNEAAVSMCAFRGALYVGGGIAQGGYDRLHRVGPAAPELIRIHPDDTWDLVVGEARETPQGFKHPLSGFEPGFDNVFNGYFWRMTEFDGHLYLGTFKWSVLLPYVQAVKPGDRGERLARWLGLENLVNFDAGFDLFRSRDGVRWAPVTTNGFGNRYNYGARTLVGTPYGLFVGTANPFGPNVAVQTANGFMYAPNPRGGAEVWLGTVEEANGASDGRLN